MQRKEETVAACPGNLRLNLGVQEMEGEAEVPPVLAGRRGVVRFVVNVEVFLLCPWRTRGERQRGGGEARRWERKKLGLGLRRSCLYRPGELVRPGIQRRGGGDRRQRHTVESLSTLFSLYGGRREGRRGTRSPGPLDEDRTVRKLPGSCSVPDYSQVVRN
jgi:hypothetical protein